MALYDIKTDYAFLAHPPPQPSVAQTPTTRRRSNTFSAIVAWASHVQPGSPAPCSPPLSKGRRTSLLPITPTPTTAHTTSPSLRDHKVDLTAVGYTSVFLQLPNTPISASLSFPVKPPPFITAKNIPVPPPPSPTSKPRSLTRFRSLSVIRSRGRSKSVSAGSPSKMKAKNAAASVKRKKATYATTPPPLANELALMQFADGGSMENNIRRVMAAQSKAAGTLAVADVYRGGEGRIWWDEDEEWEYAHLLGEGDEFRPRASGDLQWVTFGSNPPPSMACIPVEDRRGSVSTQDSDLDPNNIVQPVDPLDAGDPAPVGSATVPLATPQLNMSVLALPSRPRRAARHLRKPGLLVDVAFSSPKSPVSPGASVGRAKPKGKARRRPAPLQLSPPSPGPMHSPIDPGKVRQDFIEASFEPAPVSVPASPQTPWTAMSVTTPTAVDARRGFGGHYRAISVPWRTVSNGVVSVGMKKKPSVLNMMGLFRSGRRQDTVC